MATDLVTFTNPISLISLSPGSKPTTSSVLGPTESQDWLSTTAAVYHPATRKIYATTTFNNLWQIDPASHTATKLSSDGWGTCSALVSDPTTKLLFAFCRKLYVVDAVTGAYEEFLPSKSFLDIWSKVTSACVLGPNLYCTTATSALYRISVADRTVENVSSASWGSCQALLPAGDRLYAFCTKLWIVNPDSGATEAFSEEGGLFADLWGNLTSATVVRDTIYVVTKAGKIWEVDTATRSVKEVASAWGFIICKALVALEPGIAGKL